MHHAPHLVTIGNTHTRRRRRRRGHCPLGPPRAAPVQPTLPCPRCEYCDFCTASTYSASAYSSSRGCVVGRALLRALGALTWRVTCRGARVEMCLCLCLCLWLCLCLIWRAKPFLKFLIPLLLSS